MKMLQQQQQQQQNVETTSVTSRTTKSTTGNLLGLNNPLGVTDNPNYSRTTPDIIGESWNNATAEAANFHHYNDDTTTTITNEHQNKREQHGHEDEDLTSMLQTYLDHQPVVNVANGGPEELPDFHVYHQKSPGQQSSDSGFSGDNNNAHQKFNPAQNMFDLADYDANGEDLSQLVDQVLSSIDAQFPQDPDLQYHVDNASGNNR